jgi:hypothetical protein
MAFFSSAFVTLKKGGESNLIGRVLSVELPRLSSSGTIPG